MPYQTLAKMIDRTLTAKESGPDGVMYQIEVQAFWDDKKGGDIRVMVKVDGGEVSAFRPLADSFIVAPDGSFVGEDLREPCP